MQYVVSVFEEDVFVDKVPEHVKLNVLMPEEFVEDSDIYKPIYEDSNEVVTFYIANSPEEVKDMVMEGIEDDDGFVSEQIDQFLKDPELTWFKCYFAYNDNDVEMG